MSDITLRPVMPEDEALLFEVYASTRRDEIAAWGWDAARQKAFLQMQFRAQQQAYEISYEGSNWDLILVDCRPAGRIIVRRTDAEVLGVDIALLPEYRGAGIGSHLIGELQAEAAAAGKLFVFQVQRSNLPAIRLYERLGFTVIGASDFTLTMEWKPSSPTS